jgi:tetratricopeptide (TPR) repeat protein
MRMVIPALLSVPLAAGPLLAQEPEYNDRVARALPSNWADPGCSIKDGYYLVGSGSSYLFEATKTSVPDNKTRMYGDAVRVLEEAILRKGQADNGAAWYWLGRAYMRQGDVAGLDSTFARAIELIPDCADEINEYRRAAWVALIRPGAEFLQAGNNDSALVLLRAANDVYQEEPNALYYLGILFANTGEADSAAVYFRASAEVASQNETFVEDRNQATFNLGVVLGTMGAWAEAATVWERYLEWVPDDLDATKALAQSYRNSGQDEKAQALEATLLAAATAPSADLSGMSTSDIYNFGVNAFNDGKFSMAAEAFGAVLVEEPHNRDAMYNRSNAIYAVVSGLRQEVAALSGEEAATAEERLQAEARRLIESAEYLLAYAPLNGDAMKLQGEGYRVLEDQDRLLEVFTEITAAPVTLEVVGFDSGEGGAVLTANATGRQPQSIDGTNLEATAVTITVEFLNQADEVVASQDVTLPVLAPDATEEVVVEGQGSDITWWRYRQVS